MRPSLPSLRQLLGVAVFMLTLGGANLAWATDIEQFNPTGSVKRVRQVTARFSGPMVPFGDLRLPDPFTVDCPVAGKGRWIDERNWSYDFEHDLPGGVRCVFRPRAGLADVSGAPLASSQAYEFDTGGPAVVRTSPSSYQNIDERQIFIVGLDAVAQEAGIAQHAWCRVEGINEKVPVRLLEGSERSAVLKLRKAFVDGYVDSFWRAQRLDEKARAARRDGPQPIVVLQCARTLPAKAKVTLVWGAGIRSLAGVATTQDQTLDFNTRPDFTARFSCERASRNGGCIPFRPMELELNAPVARADAGAISLTGPGGKVYRGQLPGEDREWVSRVTFKGPFPERSSFKLKLPAALKDDSGRTLVNAARFPLTVRTDASPPLVKFPAAFGIIEAKGNRLLPVTVRNVEPALAGGRKTVGASLRLGEDDQSVIDWLHRLSSYGWVPQQPHAREMVVSDLDVHARGKFQRFTLPKPNGARAFEVIGIPLRRNGFHVVELASPKLGKSLLEKGGTAYVTAAALVTNMVVHFKHGMESSLVWVTTLDKARPVAGAKVAVRNCAGKLLWEGQTDARGLAHVGQELDASCRGGRSEFFVSARFGGDFTFTLSDWKGGIETWRYNLGDGQMGPAAVKVHTVFDRPLFRAGETVHMKHFARKWVSSGFALPPGVAGKRKLELLHVGSDERYELELDWHANGSAHNEWKIPADAKLGTYEVIIDNRVAGSFRVEQFRVPTMRALLKGSAEPLVGAREAVLVAQVSYLAGGGAALAPVKLRTLVEPSTPQFRDYDEFSFAAGDISPGKEEGREYFDDDYRGRFPGANDEGMEEGEDGVEGTSESSDGQERGLGQIPLTRALMLDKQGGARITVDSLPQAAKHQDLVAELSYQDANGETLTSATRIALWPSRYVVGIKTDSWMSHRDSVKFQAAVLDVRGQPVGGARVEVAVFKRDRYSHRRRLLGGFYAYEDHTEVRALGRVCEGQTDSKGLLHCDVKAPEDGNLILRARVLDPEQRAATTISDLWVRGSGEWLFAQSDSDRMDLLPEKKHYEPGDTAVFQVRSPFRKATALVTVEREGLLDAFVTTVDGVNPTIQVPIKGNYAPNVYVSAMLVRGRVGGIQPTALVDLGRPAYKMGIAPLRVGWSEHELKVEVQADRPVYKVRDKAEVSIRVARANGRALPAGTEVAVAAIDAALLELLPNPSWDLLTSMMSERSLQVETSTAQMQVIGKRHFGRKAYPHGGGGGRTTARELFDTLLLWKARVVLDADGRAKVTVPLNDALSAFRIVAVASGASGLFGTGQTEVRSSQDLMLLSGLPALVREGDQVRATFTLRNTTTQALAVKLSARMTPEGGKASVLAPQALVLEAGQAQEAAWDITVPAGTPKLAWDVEAASDSSADRLKVSQQVVAPVPVKTLQATLMQISQPQTMKVQAPADALPGRGGITVSYSARLGGDLPGVREYMERYPYSCLEQRTSRAVALQNSALWDEVVGSLPAHLDGDGMAKYFPSEWHGHDILTSYLLAISHEADYEIPAALLARMEDGLRAFVQGKLERLSLVPAADLAVRKLAALDALSRRAPIHADLLASINIEPNLWPTSAVIDWYQVLQRSPDLPDRAARLKQVGTILRARLNLQGTTMGFSTERTDDWWWLMASPDVNANRLLLAVLEQPDWQADMGRLARGTMGRQQRGHWSTTIANAWGRLAISKFSARFESQPVSGTTSARLGKLTQQAAWTQASGAGNKAAGASAPAQQFAWPGAAAADLVLSHAGTGKPWTTVQSRAAIPLKSALSTGYRITRKVTPVEQKVAGRWSRGDIYRVRLEVDAQSDMTWVVVDDPIPAGATAMGSGLGRGDLGDRNDKVRGWVWPAFVERSFEAYRAYFAFVPKGKFSVEYTVRLNNPGLFQLPPTHVEAMYSPEMFGDLPNAALAVGR
jgi:hypothetical protein